MQLFGSWEAPSLFAGIGRRDTNDFMPYVRLKRTSFSVERGPEEKTGFCRRSTAAALKAHMPSSSVVTEERS